MFVGLTTLYGSSSHKDVLLIKLSSTKHIRGQIYKIEPPSDKQVKSQESLLHHSNELGINRDNVGWHIWIIDGNTSIIPLFWIRVLGCAVIAAAIIAAAAFSATVTLATATFSAKLDNCDSPSRE
mmetsp:Transcript_16622/g.21628  ORF Transcript_16622/g.21628 Transcript_16622/m.21628 type:complete len:125 (+) Transcript_16622:31-405(+)